MRWAMRAEASMAKSDAPRRAQRSAAPPLPAPTSRQRRPGLISSASSAWAAKALVNGSNTASYNET